MINMPQLLTPKKYWFFPFQIWGKEAFLREIGYGNTQYRKAIIAIGF